MVFSSKVFLFYFLPCVLLGYALTRRWRRLSNLFLTAVSLGFYAWGEPRFMPVMLGSIFVNWLFGLRIAAAKEKGRRPKGLLTLMCVFDLGLLGVYKYLNFITENLHAMFPAVPVTSIALPIGISFFTFQAMSYCIDVYRGDGRAQKSFINVCLYISFFPQLIAGPIVRYQTVADEITNRRETWADFTEGCRRFMIGLCKKAILANQLGLLADQVFGMDMSLLSVGTAWLGAAAYLLQVFCDFAGYSDMAIGLGRMFGFHFPENFDYPFISKSVAEFWRRWHISLTTWFRDYLYFPLGGSRVRPARLVFNMFMVWALTGLWHGAAWTYLLWGIGFWAVQVVERFTGFGKYMEKKGTLGIVYAMFMVVTCTVMIRCTDLKQAGAFYGTMFGLAGTGLWDASAGMFLREYGWCLFFGGLTGLPVIPFLKRHIPEPVLETAGGIALIALTLIAVSCIAVVGYNPFIYFNF